MECTETEHKATAAAVPVTGDLARLAGAFGVATEHHGWRGDVVYADEETVRAVLGALGVDASTPDAVRHALVAHEAARRGRLLPPVIVTRAGRAEAFAAHCEPGARVELWIELEDGGVRRDLAELGRNLPPAVDGTVVQERSYTLPADLPLGWHTLHARVTATEATDLGSGGEPESAAEERHVSVPVAVSPARLPAPPGRTWGFMVQLYSLLSRRSWGMGDLADLADLAGWSARRHGAGFVLVNPLHAASPVAPVEPSPYLPVSRRFTDPMYVRVEAVPEYAYLSPVEHAVAEELRLRTGDLDEGAGAAHTADRLQRDRVRAAKREALALVHRVPRSPGREAAYRAFLAAEGRWLDDHATWCALVEEHGPDWHAWPAELHDPDAPAVRAERRRLAPAVDFHRWCQWVADEQLAHAHRTARDAGMPVGVVHDLAVGVHPDGSDAWLLGSARGGEVLALGATGGAPPDAMNAFGQDWSQPPWHPVRLAEAGYAPYRELLRSVFRNAGAVRVDHILGLFRFWWIPRGNRPDRGAYVRYDHEAMVGILALEAHRAGAVVVGEDLGTVEPWVRDYLVERGMLGTSVLWFERDAAGPVPPEDWRELSFATVTTHDLPPTAARLAGEHVDLWAELGLLPGTMEAARAEAADELASWVALLNDRGLLRPGAGERETVEALHRLLVRTPSRMLGVWLPDAVGDRRPQNLPGTSREYPNWLLPVADGAGRRVLLEDLAADARAASLARVLRGL
ncbi:4-alpha-glucanotransferase [Yinghuangia seranimata]|uniref:4-alpha-glucanotransferase n=1 Tax=Yinghuangia seranimata TaxID=408067 RepID=UPI00248B10D1|nr:4-alpha-glucanotransferase [Yinghuangia seranimata]MDI2127347.1 4-alpha-glucanotransferase [Yinghuangia seranimata]